MSDKIRVSVEPGMIGGTLQYRCTGGKSSHALSGSSVVVPKPVGACTVFAVCPTGGTPKAVNVMSRGTVSCGGCTEEQPGPVCR